jgi:hypothetical protein
MGWFSRKPQPKVINDADVIDDAEVARAMLSLAEKFISGVAAEGWTFSWDCAEIFRLDELCDGFSNDDPEVRHSLIMAMGAYLGELMVRCGGGHWSYDPQDRAAVVDMPNGLRACPHNKVAKRLDFGPEHCLLHFYQYGLTREVPPGGKLREL